MSQIDKYKEVLQWAKQLVKAEEASLKACESLRNLEPGASRARSTTLNAKWSTAAEHRDRIAHKLHIAVVRADLAERFADDYYGEQSSGHKWCPVQIVRERP